MLTRWTRFFFVDVTAENQLKSDKTWTKTSLSNSNWDKFSFLPHLYSTSPHPIKIHSTSNICSMNVTKATNTPSPMFGVYFILKEPEPHLHLCIF